MDKIITITMKQRCFFNGIIFVFLVAFNVWGQDAAGNDPMDQSKRLSTIIVDKYAPYTFVNKDGIPDGFSVDLIKAVTNAMGRELDIRADTWERARNALQSGEIDLLPMMAYSKEREAVFDFSVPHTIAYDAFFTRKNSVRIKSVDDLKGKTIIVMKNDQAHDYIVSSGAVSPERLVLISSLTEALKLLSSGKGDAALMPKLVGLIVAENLGLTDIELAPFVVEAYNRPFSFAVKEGNKALLERLNQGLNIVKNTGQYDEIYTKWFGHIEPAGFPLKKVLKYVLGVILAFALAGSVLLFWSFSLKKQVILRTKTLESEIAERKKAEKSLEKSEERYRSLVESQTDLVCRFAPDGTFLFVNDAYCKFSGKPKQELIGKKWRFIPVGDDIRHVENELAALSPSFPTVVIENRVVSGKGEIRWMQFVNTGFFEKNGELVEIQSVGRDITELKEAEERVIELLDLNQKIIWVWLFYDDSIERYCISN